MSMHHEGHGAQLSRARRRFVASYASYTPGLSASTAIIIVEPVDGVAGGRWGVSNSSARQRARFAGRRRPSSSLYMLQPLVVRRGPHYELSAHKCRELLLAHCNDIVSSVATELTAPNETDQLPLTLKRDRPRGRILECRLRSCAPPFRAIFYACSRFVSWASSVVVICAVLTAAPRRSHVAGLLMDLDARCRSSTLQVGRRPDLATGIGRH